MIFIEPILFSINKNLSCVGKIINFLIGTIIEVVQNKNLIILFVNSQYEISEDTFDFFHYKYA